VTLEPGSTELNPIKMIDQGTDQFGIVGGPEILMTGRTRGARIKAIGLLHVNSNFVTILTKKDSKYQKLSDLKGHEVGFYYGHISTDVLRSLFKKENVNVKEVDIGFNYNLFIADKLPAQWAFTTTAGLTLPEKGIQVHEISPADYGIITQGHTIITNEKLLAENPDLVIRFTSAIIEATKYSIEHVDETIESILKRDKNFSKILALKQLEIYNKTILNNQKILWIDAPILEDTKDRLSLLKLIPEDFDMKNAYDNSFLKEYYTSHK
jgi:NitT/TauT family transport system substrate-binding protein